MLDMQNDRDMYYSSYGYGGYSPNMIPNPTNGMNNYNHSWMNDINERINRLEREIKRLDTRVSRLETPYGNNDNNNNMYMM